MRQRRDVRALLLTLVLAGAAVHPAWAQTERPPMPPGAMPFDPDEYGVPQGFYENRQGTVTPGPRYRGLGPTVIGPGGIVPPAPPRPRRVEAPKPKVLTPQERDAAIRKALIPRPSLAEARRQTLDTLYAKLAKASDVDEAKGLATLIANVWMRTGSDTAALLMQRATVAAAAKNYDVALDLLDQVIQMQPTWAEAWNKRASVRFAAGKLDGSMEDVEHVLKLDPNHFAALEGMALILQRTGFDKRALQVYRRALAVYPHQPEIEDIVKKLSLDVEGQGI